MVKMFLPILATAAALLAALQYPATGAPIAQCSFNSPPSINDVKTISCMLENEIFELLKDVTIPTMTSKQEREECNCQERTERFKYAASPSYGVAPHIRIQHVYKSYQTYRYPENTVDLDGNSFPVTTEWILKDYISSLEGFIKYFTSSTMTGPALENAVWELNATVLSRLNAFSFSPQCPSVERNANFSSLINATCELKCATWHFNDTIDGFNNALVNQEIYKNKTDNNYLPGIVTWAGIQCCPLLQQAHNLSLIDYRALTCNVQGLYYTAHLLLQQLGEQATAQCDGASTVTGVKTWTGYYGDGESFPPVESSCGYSDKLYIYGSHFNGLEKYENDLSSLVEDGSFDCFSPLAKDTMLSMKYKLQETLPMATHWMRSHGCPSCASTCSHPNQQQVFLTNGGGTLLHETCPEMYKEVSCLARDLRTVATSLYMFLELREEAKDTWQYPCVY